MAMLVVSLDAKQDELVRRLAREKFGGKRGSLKALVLAGVEKIAAEDDRETRVKAVIARMRKGFDFGPVGMEKAYESRADIYQGKRFGN